MAHTMNPTALFFLGEHTCWQRERQKKGEREGWNLKKLRSRAVKSNWFRFNLIFDRDVAETFRFDSISIQYRFDSKYDLIQYKSASAVIKFDWPSINWPISKRLSSRMTEMLENLILHSICWNRHFFTVTVQSFLAQVFFQIDSNRIVSKI